MIRQLNDFLLYFICIIKTLNLCHGIYNVQNFCILFHVLITHTFFTFLTHIQLKLQIYTFTDFLSYCSYYFLFSFHSPFSVSERWCSLSNLICFVWLLYQLILRSLLNIQWIITTHYITWILCRYLYIFHYICIHTYLPFIVFLFSDCWQRSFIFVINVLFKVRNNNLILSVLSVMTSMYISNLILPRIIKKFLFTECLKAAEIHYSTNNF